MAQQVKFYAVGPSDAKTNENGIYFVTGGELYKGSSRFGANKVWTTKPEENAGVIGGDMYINGGVAEVFDGTSWVGITDANKWSASTYGGEGSYIQAVSQAADGTVTATVVAFPTLDTGDSDGEVKLGSDSAKVSGWDGLVASVSANASAIATNASAIESNASAIEALGSRVTGIESIVHASDNSISASSATFTDLTVDTANFTATSVAASTLTIGGSTVEQLADKQIAAIASHTETSTATGITVSVTTQGGSVTAVSVDATSFGNVMHFVGVEASTADVTDPQAGDIVIIGSEPTGGAVAGQEYIYTSASTWELIGDQNTYAIKSVVESSWATLKTAAFVDKADTVTADATTLPTGSAVAAYVSGVIDGLAGSASDSDKGVVVDVVTADGEVSTVDVSVTAASTMALNATGSADELATTAAIKSFYDNNLVWLDASGAAIA